MNEIARLRPDDATTALNVEAEQQLLGACLTNSSCIAWMAHGGGERLFGDPVHQRIAARILQMSKADLLVDVVTIKDALADDEGLKQLGGPNYLIRMAGASLSAAAMPEYIKMLADLGFKRTIIAAMSEATAAIVKAEDSAGVIAGRLEAALLAVSETGARQGPVSMLKAASVAMNMARAAYMGQDDGSVKSGLVPLDRMIGGFYPGELTLIGGRPSMGKSALALTFALNAARAGHGVVIASLEMNPEAMAVRAISEATAQRGHGVAYKDIRRGAFSKDDGPVIAQAAKDLGELPIMFLPRAYTDIGALMSGAKQCKRIMGDQLRLVIVDYAQLLKSQAKLRYEQITEISIALKAMAGQLDLPVIALSQLSRAVESRDDKRPILSDLRESGQLEQDADAVLFCYRPAYYLEREKPDDDDIEALADWRAAMAKAANLLEVIVAKQRQGEIGTAHLRANMATNMVWE